MVKDQSTIQQRICSLEIWCSQWSPWKMTQLVQLCREECAKILIRICKTDSRHIPAVSVAKDGCTKYRSRGIYTCNQFGNFFIHTICFLGSKVQPHIYIMEHGKDLLSADGVMVKLDGQPPTGGKNGYRNDRSRSYFFSTCTKQREMEINVVTPGRSGIIN